MEVGSYSLGCAAMTEAGSGQNLSRRILKKNRVYRLVQKVHLNLLTSNIYLRGIISWRLLFNVGSSQGLVAKLTQIRSLG